jgi:hypothetical protein
MAKFTVSPGVAISEIDNTFLKISSDDSFKPLF